VFLFIYYCPLLLFYDSHCTHNWAVTLTERKLLVSFNNDSIYPLQTGDQGQQFGVVHVFGEGRVLSGVNGFVERRVFSWGNRFTGFTFCDIWQPNKMRIIHNNTYNDK